jgi:aspartyl/glutamyl-tRNA(Asn/Gln) amidotransferase C subunit
MVIRYTGYGTMNPPEKKILMSEKEQDISPEIFEHLVKLAALELDEKEAEYLRRELNHQLSAIHELEAIRLDPDLPLASHGVSYDAHNSSALRADEWRPCPDVKDITAQAPQFEDGYLVVPDIPHTTLE